ncbi:MAG: hypothetical protein ACI4U3_01505 [Traorella sp.]
MKEKMLLVGVNMARRYKTKEKELFLQETIKLCQEKGLKTSFQTKKSSVMKICNLVVGDVQKADLILACSYDTPSVAIFPKLKYFPFNPSYNVKEELKNTILQCICGSLFFLVIFFLIRGFMSSSLIVKILRVIFILICAFGCYRSFKPAGNRVNFARNSASVAVLFKLIENVKNPKIAYVFLDQNCSSYEGAKLMRDELSQNKHVLFLDNLASGDKTVLAYRKKEDIQKFDNVDWMKKEYDETSNLLSYFDHAIMLSCGKIKDKKFYVEKTRTKYDYEVDMERLTQIYEKLYEIVEVK